MAHDRSIGYERYGIVFVRYGTHLALIALSSSGSGLAGIHVLSPRMRRSLRLKSNDSSAFSSGVIPFTTSFVYRNRARMSTLSIFSQAHL